VEEGRSAEMRRRGGLHEVLVFLRRRGGVRALEKVRGMVDSLGLLPAEKGLQFRKNVRTIRNESR
jgi:hypothetical protein